MTKHTLQQIHDDLEIFREYHHSIKLDGVIMDVMETRGTDNPGQIWVSLRQGMISTKLNMAADTVFNSRPQL